MKGKTGSNKMRGGGLARKGVGAAMKGGGKVKKMADGGMNRPGFPSNMERMPGRMPMLPGKRPIGAGEPGRGGGFGSGWGGGATLRPIGSTPVRMPIDPMRVKSGMNAVGEIPMKSNGGKVAKYAKGGAVKMTAGAGSGLGRLEKASAHKAAPRVKAENLKNGGKVKKMADGGPSSGASKVDNLQGKILSSRKRDIEEAVPTSLFQRAMFRRKSGDPDNPNLRKSMLDASEKRTKRDLALLNAYGADAMKARSFMAKKDGGKVKGKK